MLVNSIVRPSSRDHELLRSLAQRIDPADSAGHNNLGVLYFNKGMVAESVEAFHRALEIDPAMHVAQRNLEIAYLSTGFYDELTQNLARRLRVAPEDFEARWRLAQALRYTGHLEEAAAELRRLLASTPTSLRLLLELGRVEKEAGRFREALRAYERARRVDPRSAILHLHLGELHYHQGNSEEARRALLSATEVEPRLGEAWHILSFVLGDLGDAERASAAFRRARELRPELGETESGLSIDRNSVARYGELLGDRAPRPSSVRGRFLGHYNLGLAYRQGGLYDEALQEFARSRESGEDPFLAEQATAEVLLSAGKNGSAAKRYRKLLDGAPDSPKLWNELGVALHRLGELDEATECYRRALREDDRYLLAANNLGVARIDAGDRSDSRHWFERAVVAEGDGFAQPLCNLGLLSLGEKRLRESLMWYRRCVEGDALSPAGWTGVGVILSETDQLGEARQALARAIEIEPESAEARYRLAFVLNRLGDREGSLRETRQALSLDPYFTTPGYRLAIELQFEHAEVVAPSLSTATRVPSGESVIDFSPGEFELAGIFEKLRGDDAAVTEADDGYRLAQDYLSKGMLGQALAEIRRVVLAGGDPVDAALLGGEVFLRQRLEGEALERFETALARLEGTLWGEKHERAWLGRGWSLVELGQAEGAGQAAMTVRDRNPSSTEAIRLHAEALLLMGRSGQSADEFARLAEVDEPNASTLMRLGAAATAAGQVDRAAVAYERAIELDSNLLAARVELGALLLGEGDFDAAADHARATLEALPGYSEAALLLANAEHARGESDAGVDVLVELLEMDLYHLPALHRLGEILLESGNAADAATAFRRVLRFDPGSGQAWLRLGDALEHSAASQEAAKCWERAADLAPADQLERRAMTRPSRHVPGGAVVLPNI
ncbi:MAG: tetratricopeptide repeat protein [Gemmatimonas sp.]|nr:tetratricopeptide repeat protein [Gemmatimonas sp.]